MTTATTLTTHWTTICTTGYTGSVSRDENRAAHGGVCHVQVRRTRGGQTIARRVNTNGRHTEIGESFSPTANELASWKRVAACTR